MLDPSTARELIKPHMAVVCSEGRQFGTVDRLVEDDTIKLTRDDSGQHHFIPIAWVTTVDDRVHVDRPGKQAMEQWLSEDSIEGAVADEARPAGTPPPERDKGRRNGKAEPPAHVATSTDETRGQPLAARVQARVAELEAAAAELDPESIERREIDLAVATAESLTTGDVSHPSDVVAVRLSEWLERNKYLAMKAAPIEAAHKPAKKAQ